MNFSKPHLPESILLMIHTFCRCADGLPDDINQGPTFGPSCLSGSSRVTVTGKGDVLLVDARIGHLIRVADGDFDLIFSFRYYKPDGTVGLLRIDTVDGTRLEILSLHLICAKGYGAIATFAIPSWRQALQRRRCLDKSPVHHYGTFPRCLCSI